MQQCINQYYLCSLSVDPKFTVLNGKCNDFHTLFTTRPGTRLLIFKETIIDFFRTNYKIHNTKRFTTFYVPYTHDLLLTHHCQLDACRSSCRWQRWCHTLELNGIRAHCVILLLLSSLNCDIALHYRARSGTKYNNEIHVFGVCATSILRE